MAADQSGKIVRHHLIDRLYHWLMAIAVFILLGTAFLPIVGIKFQWIDIHWMTGVFLTLIVLVHIVRALFWQDWRSMLVTPSDIRDIASGARETLTGGAEAPKPAKYNGLQKFYHLAVALLLIAIIITGLLMMLKIDTPFWRRSPYWFTNYWWGIIYAFHGLAAMAMITMIIIHVYFASRPEEWYLTRSMFRGWITRKEYESHHDTGRWKP
ncbi:MAG: cytochrome b/b6 domain-containing protein [Alphaproteobacteria bacterium]|nr:cytochrome b/b6 domain-containing protein [Alphaproteobacteria bacterium]